MYDNCEEMPEEEWVTQRFEGRCYFYPERDCPGWDPGRACGRIGDIIPKDADYA